MVYKKIVGTISILRITKIGKKMNMHDDDIPICSEEQTYWKGTIDLLRERLDKEVKNPENKPENLLMIVEAISRAMDLGVNANNFDGMKKSFKKTLEERRCEHEDFHVEDDGDD